MKVRLDHALGRDEVRRRLDQRKDEIAGYFPKGMATITTSWAGQDHMDFALSVSGQSVTGAVDIADDHVVVALQLPLILSFLGPRIEQSMRKEATRLLAAPD